MAAAVTHPGMSIVIPCHNGKDVLGPCLKAIFASEVAADEVIVVDDASTDRSPEIAAAFPCRTLRLDANLGAGGARNEGARAARHDLIVFIDADTEVHADALGRVRRRFEDPSVQVLCGLVDGRSLNGGIVPDLTALEWAYAHLGLREGRTLNSFFAAFRRKAFLDLGGFPTHYRAAGGEEFEMSQRIVSETPIWLDPEIRIHHRFKPFAKRFRDLVSRSRHLGNLFLRKKEVNEVASLRSAARAACSGLIVASLLLVPLSPWALALTFLSMLAFVIASSGFYGYVRHERGTLFLLMALPFDLALSFAVFLGAARAVLARGAR